MIEYRTKISFDILFPLTVLSILIIVIDYFYKQNIYFIGVFFLFFVVNTIWNYYTKQVKKISFLNNEVIVINKSFFFKEKILKIEVEKVSYSFKKQINYPNKSYILDFYFEENKININKSYNFIAFSEKDIKEIIKKLEELNIKRVE